MLKNPGGDELVAGSRTSAEFRRESIEEGIWHRIKPAAFRDQLQALHNLFKLSRWHGSTSWGWILSRRIIGGTRSPLQEVPDPRILYIVHTGRGYHPRTYLGKFTWSGKTAAWFGIQCGCVFSTRRNKRTRRLQLTTSLWYHCNLTL